MNTWRGVSIKQEPKDISKNTVEDKIVTKPKYDKELVFNIQKLLNELGYESGRPDGIYGNKTSTAIKMYQKGASIKIDGLPTKKLYESLLGKSKSSHSDIVEVMPGIYLDKEASKSFKINKDTSSNSNPMLNENLKTCLDGNYPTLCKKNLLTSSELASVIAAEKRENIKTCLDGNYPTLCKKNLLTSSELASVIAAEKRENIKTCLDGNYPTLCKKNLLTSSELKQVNAAESKYR